MKLIDYCNKYYTGRAECAASLGISRHYFNNLISNNTHVVQLFDGSWMTLTKYNKRFS